MTFPGIADLDLLPGHRTLFRPPAQRICRQSSPQPDQPRDVASVCTVLRFRGDKKRTRRFQQRKLKEWLRHRQRYKSAVYAGTITSVIERNGGDDGTRTRVVCRDSAARNALTTTYKTRGLPNAAQIIQGCTNCGLGRGLKSTSP